MAYTPKTWVNRQVERPRTYNLENNSDGTITLLPAEGVVIEEGTPLEASSMNTLENGLTEVSETVGNGIRDYIRQPAFATTEGGATAYTVTLNPAPTAILDGFGITIVPHVTNGTNATLNINGLGAFPLKKQNGQPYTAGRIVSGKPYSFRKVGMDFLADSAGGSGTAQPAHVLAPYTFTNDDNEEYPGTMVTITSGEDPALSVGQWPNGDLAVYPRQGYRKGGSGAGEIRVSTAQLQSADAEFRADRILEGNNIYGVSGSILNRSARNAHTPGNTHTVWVGDRFFIQPPNGYYDGSTWVTAPVPAMIPNNIRSGVNMNGVVGTVREYFGGTFPVNFSGPGAGQNAQGYYEILRLPAGYSYSAFAGSVQLGMSSTNIYQWAALVVQDIAGRELIISSLPYQPSYSRYSQRNGFFVDRPNRRIKTWWNGSGYENQGGWEGNSDIGPEGSVANQNFDFNNRLIFYFRVDASMGGGYTTCYFNGQMVYN